LIGMVVLTVLITSISGCSRQTKHKVLTFFFTGVPPLEEEKKEVGEKEKSAEETKMEKKIAPKPKKLFSHTPYALRMCDQCHQTSASFGRFRPKGSAVMVRSGLGSPGMLVVPLKELCVKCHKHMSASSVFKEELWLHAPAAQGKCTICHGSHQSAYPNLLLEKPDKICTQCHSEGFMLDSADHRKSSECLSCHNPHLGKDRMLLSKDYKEVKQPVAPLPWDVQTRLCRQGWGRVVKDSRQQAAGSGQKAEHGRKIVDFRLQI
jgi:predicted CXXCH cytochrome family protein